MFLPLGICLLGALGVRGVTRQVAGDLHFTNRIHGISGTVALPDSQTISITDFNYDGGGVVVHLYSYAPGVPARRGSPGTTILLPSSVGNSQGLFRNSRYSNVDFSVSLPQGMDVCDIGILTVWCQPFDVVFGFVEIPRSKFVNNGADPCTVIGGTQVTPTVNSTTAAPSTTSTASIPSTSMTATIPTSATSTTLTTSTRTLTTSTLTTPKTPSNSSTTSTNPTSTKGGTTMIPQSTSTVLTTPTTSKTSTTPTTSTPSVPLEFDNCIPLHKDLQLSWRVDTNNSQVRFKLCGCLSLEPGTNQYMGFGLSRSTTCTLMLGADPTIAWVDSTTSEPQAIDYHLSSYSQCRAGVGACPDTLDSSGKCTNDVTDVSGSVTDGKQCVSFVRHFSTSDSTCDITIDPTNQNQYIVWGVGGLGETAFKHFTRAESGDAPIHLGRIPQDQCIDTEFVCRGCQPFVNERIVARNGATFLAQIGPSGNERGYLAITDQISRKNTASVYLMSLHMTRSLRPSPFLLEYCKRSKTGGGNLATFRTPELRGQASWGIAWYINGTLIPELVVERGQNYTFITEGGTDSNDLSVYHPFYITDSISGGRLQNSPMDQASETVYAGFDANDTATGVGPLCVLMETANSEIVRQSCGPLQPYVNSLVPSSSCNSGEPGQFLWSPDETTPDVVYYQCATHINLGWKITVLDEVMPISPGPTEDILNADSSVSVHGFHASLVYLHAAAVILGSLCS